MLHVSGELHPYTMGGIGVHVADLCDSLVRLNQEITVYTTLPRNSIKNQHPYQVKDFHRHIILFGNIIPLNMILPIFRNRYKYDVIHAHSHLFFCTVICAAIRRIGSSPLVITNHGFHSQSAPVWLQNIYLPTVGKWTLNSADKILCYTNEAKRELVEAGISEGKIAIVPIGVDTNVFYPRPKTTNNEKFTVMWAARLVPVKGLKYMVLAFEEFHKQHPDTQLIILGEGEYYNQLKEHVVKNKEEDFIRVMGKIAFADLPQTYSNADVFCMTSGYEAGPKTIFEAMACGCPVISNNLKHLEDIVPNGGYIVQVKETEKFVELLNYCYLNRNVLEELGKRGKEYVHAHHSWEGLVSENLHISEDIYTSVLY